MIQLNKSEVVYDPITHAYHLDGVELVGITKRIKKRVCPDEYKGVPDKVVGAAQDKGHATHAAVELYDTVGIETDSPEFRGYMIERELHPFLTNHLASEYVVSDNVTYASPIDKVCGDDEEGFVNLVDIKRTATRNIPYVTWQLSVYKKFFEMLNPHLKVKNIYLLWLREDKHLLQQLVAHTADEVDKMLYTEEPLDVPANESALMEIGNMEQDVADSKQRLEYAKAEYEQLSKGLTDVMEKYGINKYEGALLNITKKSDSIRRSFDSKSFEKDNPELYAKYVTENTIKGGILIKVKQ